MSRNCLICWRESLQENVEREEMEKNKVERNKNKFILQNFLKHYKIPLHLLTQFCEWNISSHPQIFCDSCTVIAKNIIRLENQLIQIQNSIKSIDTIVKNNILQSTSTRDTNFNDKSSSNCAPLIIRDLIVGPSIELTRLQLDQVDIYKNKNDDWPMDNQFDTPSNISDDPDTLVNRRRRKIIKNPLIKLIVDDDFEMNAEQDNSDQDYILSDDELTKTETKRTKRRTVGSIHRGKKIGEDTYEYQDYEFTGNKEIGYTCALCPDPRAKCKRIGGIYQHIRQKHVLLRSHLCPSCGKQFVTSNGLSHHQQTVHNSERVGVICHVCGQLYKDDKLLEVHMSVVHFPKYIHKCDICQKSFKQVQQMNNHKRAVHFKEKRFYCDECGKGFYTSSGLDKHKSSRQHSLEKPLECLKCGTRFNSRATKNRHVKQFHEVKSPPESTENYTTEGEEGGGGQEVTTNEDNDPLKCKLCGLQYNRQNNLTRHLLQIHHINIKGLSWKSRPSASFNLNMEKGKLDNDEDSNLRETEEGTILKILEVDSTIPTTTYEFTTTTNWPHTVVSHMTI